MKREQFANADHRTPQGSSLHRLAWPLIVLCFAATARAEPARPAAELVDSIGFATHFNYGDTPYGNAYDGVKRRLLELGVRHLRDGFDTPPHRDRILDLARGGVHFCVVAEPTLGPPDAIRDTIKMMNAQVPGAIDAVEGPNEPDFFWVTNKRSYGGKNGADGPPQAVAAAALYLRDLYKAMKADPATAGVTVIGIALGRTYEPGHNPIPARSLADCVDWGNFHPYFGGNPFSYPYPYAGVKKFLWDSTNPGTNMGGESNYALDTYAPPYHPRPMAATEAGCATDTNGTSETAHGKYIPRMFLEYFRLGIRRTYSYELVDEFPDANSREARFGILRRDLSPKPAYTALRNLIAALADDTPADQKPADLPITLKASPAGEYTKVALVHHVLLSKSNGRFALVVWHEVTSEDGSTKPRRQIVVPPMPCDLAIDTGQYQLSARQWDDGGEPRELPLTEEPGHVRFAATDHLTVIEIVPRK